MAIMWYSAACNALAMMTIRYIVKAHPFIGLTELVIVVYILAYGEVVLIHWCSLVHTYC